MPAPGSPQSCRPTRSARPSTARNGGWCSIDGSGTAEADAIIDFVERRDRLRLFRSQNVGPVTYRQLMAHYGSAGAALDALPALTKRSGGRSIKICRADTAQSELDALDRLDAELITLGEPDYPDALAAIDDAPPVLAVRGCAKALRNGAIAIVGARNASTNGRNLARRLAAGLCDAAEGDTYVIVSGLARGIDAAAHKSALEAGGTTVAVMAGGVDVVYPPEHEGLYADICANGAVVSELPPGLQPQAAHFPRRNRIIAGLSLGVVSSRRRRVRARSSPPGWRWNRAATCSPCRARRSIRAAAAPIG